MKNEGIPHLYICYSHGNEPWDTKIWGWGVQPLDSSLFAIPISVFIGILASAQYLLRRLNGVYIHVSEHGRSSVMMKVTVLGYSYACSSMMVTRTLSNGPVVVPSGAFTREIWNE